MYRLINNDWEKVDYIIDNARFIIIYDNNLKPIGIGYY
jgi:hypothetical protein